MVPVQEEVPSTDRIGMISEMTFHDVQSTMFYQKHSLIHSFKKKQNEN